MVRAGAIEDAPAILSSVLMYESNVGRHLPKPELEIKWGATSGAVRIIARAVGGRGPNAEYLFNTAAHLDAMGVEDIDMAALAGLVRGLIVKPAPPAGGNS